AWVGCAAVLFVAYGNDTCRAEWSDPRRLDFDLPREPLCHFGMELHRIGSHGSRQGIEYQHINPALGIFYVGDEALIFSRGKKKFCLLSSRTALLPAVFGSLAYI